MLGPESRTSASDVELDSISFSPDPSEMPSWLLRVTHAGVALTEASSLAMESGVCINVKRDDMWIAQCMAIERKIFAKHEAMDIAYEVSHVPGTALLCASPVDTLTGPAFGGSISIDTCVGYAIVQVQDCAEGSNSFSALSSSSMLISKLAVTPRLRRRGVGRALLAAAIGYARSQRVVCCTLHVDVENSGARSLYEAAGFTVLGDRLENFYRPGRHAFEMALRLETGGVMGADVG